MRVIYKGYKVAWHLNAKHFICVNADINAGKNIPELFHLELHLFIDLF